MDDVARGLLALSQLYRVLHNKTNPVKSLNTNGDCAALQLLFSHYNTPHAHTHSLSLSHALSALCLSRWQFLCFYELHTNRFIHEMPQYSKNSSTLVIGFFIHSVFYLFVYLVWPRDFCWFMGLIRTLNHIWLIFICSFSSMVFRFIWVFVGLKLANCALIADIQWLKKL